MNKTLIVIVLPFAMLFGFVSVLVRDIGRAFKYAWFEAMIELEAAKRDWRTWPTTDERRAMMDDRKQFETMAVLREYAAAIAGQSPGDLRPSTARINYAEKISRMSQLAKDLETQS